MVKDSRCQDALTEQGLCKTYFPLSGQIKKWVKLENWSEIDHHFQALTKKNGDLFSFLSSFENFDQIEFIISIRDAANEWEEDGIWHDDGSRKLAFSVSILDNENTRGGKLLFRKKASMQTIALDPFNFGEIIIFKTGICGYEHMVSQVVSGRRIVVAGWCS